MVFIAMILTGTTTANAGVITTIDASTISWDRDNDNEADIYFYIGSYNDAVVHPEAFTSVAIPDVLTDDLNAQDPSGLSYGGNIFLFSQGVAPSRPVNGYLDAYTVTLYNVWTFNYGYIDADQPTNSSGTYYWASTTAPHTGTVPEPSTAIAMCFLGVVGFAGNRRRRRQVSAA